MEELAPPLFFAASIALVFWLLIIRPNARRQRQQGAMQQALQPGDEVMLTSGFYGTIQGLEEDRVQVELTPGTTVTVARGAVGAVVAPVPSPEALNDDDADAARASDTEEN